MNDNKVKHIIYQILLTVICVFINVAGGRLSVVLGLPLWLDSVGTILAGYTMGPVCAALIGAASNVLTGILFNSLVVAYAIASVAIGAIAGVAAEKKAFESFFSSMTVASILTFVAMGISIPLNILTRDGYTGNIWGDATIDYLAERGVGILRYPIGQYCLEFLDKTVSVLIVYAVIKFVRTIRGRMPAERAKKDSIKSGIALILFITLFSVNVTTAFAAPPNRDKLADDSAEYGSYTQTIYNGTNGLSCGEANDVASTNDGAIWVGTYAGLYRYNGQQFEYMSSYDSVKNVNCLYTDSEGRLWIGTNDSGLSICINGKITNVIKTSDGLPSDSVRSIGGGEDGYYLVGTTNGLSLVSLSGGLHLVKAYSDIKSVIKVDADREGHAAVLTSDGTVYFMSGLDIVSSFSSENGQYSSLAFSEDGSVYIGTNNDTIDIYKVSDDTATLTKTLSTVNLGQINDIYFRARQGYTFVCGDGGVGYFDENNEFTTLNVGTFGNSVDNMTMDFQQNLWFASSRMGLLKMTPFCVTDMFVEAGVEPRVVNTVAEWGDNEYYCGADNGLVIIDGKNSAEIKNNLTSEFDGIRIRCIISDDNGNLYICTDGNGITKISDAGKETTFTDADGLFGNKVRTAIKYSGGIAAGGAGGITIFDKSGNINTVKTEEGTARVLCLAADSDGTIFAGTDGDGIAVVKDGEITDWYTTEDGLSSNIILKLPTNSDGDLFVVTSNGICLMTVEKKFTYINEFPYPNNYDINFAQNGKAFVTGSAGIYVVDTESLRLNEEDMKTELLDSEWGVTTGITANACNFADDESNYYISTNEGLYKLNTRNYDSDFVTCRMDIKNVRVDGVEYNIESGVPFTIGRDAKTLAFTPEVINYTARQPYIRYKLDGYDSDFTEVPLSELGEITYSNLKSGEYIFTLSVLDSKKQRVTEQIKNVFIKENALYDHDYFFGYFFGVVAGSIAWFTWLIIRAQISRTLNAAREQVRMGNETIMTIARTLDARDTNTSMHSERVSEYSVMIARKMGFSEAECENLRKAALLHDIGKIGIPDSILNKPFRLTDEEYAIMKTHVTKGAEILKNITGIDHVVEGALYHHERYDGKGYASGLKGKEIPLYGRIICVADAFDAMTANRVYRKQLDIDYVLEELVRCSGTQFDPEIADIMISLVVNGEVDVEELYHRKEQERKERDK